MKLAHDIVIAPVISEKSLDGVAAKRYTFKVAKDSTKVEIAKAVEEIFGVKVTKVRLEESHRNAERRLQDHRVLRGHGIISQSWSSGAMPEGARTPLGDV